jgi:hypothetical protein
MREVSCMRVRFIINDIRIEIVLIVFLLCPIIIRVKDLLIMLHVFLAICQHPHIYSLVSYNWQLICKIGYLHQR